MTETPAKVSTLFNCVSAMLFLLVLVAAAIRYALPLRDGDIWFHLLYARYFIENMTIIPDHTIFSWSPTNNEFIYCSWLSELLLYAIYKLGELKGLFAFRYALVLLFILAVWHQARKLEVVGHPLTWLLCLVGLVMSYVAIFAKPEGFSLLFMTLFCWNWWRLKADGFRAPVSGFYLFPLGMLLWVNSHGGFIMGAIFLGTVLIGELLNTVAGRSTFTAFQRKHLLAVVALSGLAIMLTPYGYHYPLQIIMMHLPTPENQAYNQPIFAMAGSYLTEGPFLSFGDMANISFLLLGGLLLLNLKNRKTDFSLLLANLIFALLYAKYVRSTFYWAPVFTFSTLYLLALRPHPLFPNRVIARVLVATGVSLATVLFAGKIIHDARSYPEGFLWNGFGYSEMLPMEEAAFVREHFPTARIGNTYNTGSTLLWHLWPRNRVFIDARHFPYRQWSARYFQFQGSQEVEVFLAEHLADLWVIDYLSMGLAFWFADSPEWRLAFYGKSAAVFVRQDQTPPADTRRVGEGVNQVRSRSAFISLLTFTIKIQDWETARSLVSRTKGIQTEKAHQKKLTDFARDYVAGMAAFHQRDYEEAAVRLEAAHRYNNMLTNRKALAYCYSVMMVEAMQRGDLTAAHRLSKTALASVETTYTLYNAGIMGWVLSLKPENILPTTDEWQRHLEQFLANKPPDEEPYATAVRQTQALLAGQALTAVPRLLLQHPPEPYRQFEQIL